MCASGGGSPSAGRVGSFKGKRRDELPDREIFDILQGAPMLIGRWRQHYHRFRPHSALGYRPPAPEAIAIEPSGMTPLPQAVVAGPTSGADHHGGQVLRAGDPPGVVLSGGLRTSKPLGVPSTMAVNPALRSRREARRVHEEDHTELRRGAAGSQPSVTGAGEGGPGNPSASDAPPFGRPASRGILPE
jgi:hypothetical protein